MTNLLVTAATLAASSSSSDGDGGSGLALLLLTLGPIVYAVIYVAYRNPGARYRYEQDTDVRIDGVQVSDTFLEHKKHSSNSQLPGANSTVLRGVPGGATTRMLELAEKAKGLGKTKSPSPPGIVP